MLIVVGGDQDPQIARFCEALAVRGVTHRRLLHGAMGAPAVTWDLQTNVLKDAQGEITVSAAFMRQDVFRFLASKRQLDRDDGRAWKVMFDGFLGANPQIRLLNRAFWGKDAFNKPLALLWAAEAGLAVPETWVSADKLHAQSLIENPAIYKPIAGGDMCRPLEAGALDRVRTRYLPRPYIFQDRLEPPELRIFRVGSQCFAFDVSSSALDYRSAQDTRVTQVDVPQDLQDPLIRLADRIGLTYAAADFKTSAEDGSFRFLEINSNPMFAAFDEAAEGALVSAMIDYLTDPQSI